MERRTFLGIAAAAAAGLPLGARSAMKPYDPKARFEIKVFEVPFRTNAKGRKLLARVYQPLSSNAGAGPFPTLLDLHGGAWQRKDRTANEPMDRAVAASGVLVVAIDMTLAGEAPYPASVQDASYGVRWLKTQAKGWNGDAAALGVLGSSSGGHIAELIAMRPDDARYNAIPLAGADTTVAYVATRSPISNTFARWQNAEEMKRESLIKASKTYFQPWESIHEANPQEILERKEKVVLRPLLIMQGELDDNMRPAVQEKFAAAYRAAGGACDFHVFKGSEHEWVAKPGPQTDAAHEMVKAFIAKNLGQ
ncbi:MAG TPA: alpha/beta hydrolase [Burkholderiales bacterium]|nr:alpha/beta hydrolase [Burkholderiales bacterium]